MYLACHKATEYLRAIGDGDDHAALQWSYLRVMSVGDDAHRELDLFFEALGECRAVAIYMTKLSFQYITLDARACASLGRALVKIGAIKCAVRDDLDPEFYDTNPLIFEENLFDAGKSLRFRRWRGSREFELKLACCNLTDEGVLNLVAALDSGSPFVTTLDVSRNFEITNIACLAPSRPGLRACKTLDLDNTSFSVGGALTDETRAFLMALPQAQSLSQLSMQGHDDGDDLDYASVVAICEALTDYTRVPCVERLRAALGWEAYALLEHYVRGNTSLVQFFFNYDATQCEYGHVVATMLWLNPSIEMTCTPLTFNSMERQIAFDSESCDAFLLSPANRMRVGRKRMLRHEQIILLRQRAERAEARISELEAERPLKRKRN